MLSSGNLPTILCINIPLCYCRGYISGVELSANYPVHKTGTYVEFIAVLRPDNLFIAEYYEWTWGDAAVQRTNTTKTSVFNKMSHVYNKPGTWVVNVKTCYLINVMVLNRDIRNFQMHNFMTHQSQSVVFTITATFASSFNFCKFFPVF